MSSLTVTNAVVTTLKDGNGVEVYAAKAWVRILLTSSTPSAVASGNVSSITDNGVGLYTVNLTNALADNNWAGATLYTGAGDTYAERLTYTRGSGASASAIPVAATASGALSDTTMTVVVFR